VNRPASRLVERFLALYDELARHLQRRTGSRERAEDVMQDTYMRLLDADARNEDARIQDGRAFIYRVASNLAIDAVRREQRTQGYGEPEASLPDPGPGPQQHAVGNEQLRRLDRALRQLPPNSRLALLMFRVDGLTHAQIARRLGVSESMVAKYIGQALRHCRSQLQKE